MRRAVLLLVLFGLACSKPPISTTAGCTLANCRAMVDRCDFDVPEDADKGWCQTNALVVPDGGIPAVMPDAGTGDEFRDAGSSPDESASCVQACEAGHEGALVACVASNVSACEPSGASQSIIDVCEADQKAAVGASASGSCAHTCEVTRAQCQGQCPLGDFGGCYSCSASCGLTAAHCEASCPRSAAHCTDGKKDDDETDVDCGGSCGPCAESQDCKTNMDCVSDNCVGGLQCGAIIPCAKPGDCPSNTCLFGTCR